MSVTSSAHEEREERAAMWPMWLSAFRLQPSPLTDGVSAHRQAATVLCRSVASLRRQEEVLSHRVLMRME